MKQMVSQSKGEQRRLLIAVKVPRCVERQRQACIDHFDNMECNAAFTFCGDNIGKLFFNTGMLPPQYPPRASVTYRRAEHTRLYNAL